MNANKIFKKLVVLFICTHSIIPVTIKAQNKENPRKSTMERNKSLNPFFGGFLFENKSKGQLWYHIPISDIVQYNTVEGYVANFNLRYTKNLKEGKFYTLRPNVRYGFGNDRLQAQLTSSVYYNSSNHAFLQLSGGRFVEQFNNESALSPFGNTIATLSEDGNYLKIFERSFVELKHHFVPANNFLLTNVVSWSNRSELNNIQELVEDIEDFTSNKPNNQELRNTTFAEHQAFIVDAIFKWQKNQGYKRTGGRFVSTSNFPALSIIYKAAISGVLGSDVEYQKLAFRISKDFKTNSGSVSKFALEFGDFIANDSLNFMDFNHFNGVRTVYTDFELGNFQLLDYYEYSTVGPYLQSHFEYHLNKPLFKRERFRITPVSAVNYLWTDTGGHYWELGIGIEKLLRYFRIDFYNSWRETEHQNSGIRIAFVVGA